MREIKFRYVFKSIETNELVIYYPTIVELEHGEFNWIYFKSQQLKLIARNQFTGLKDKNGKEIYEGDLRRDKYSHLYEVAYDAYAFRNRSMESKWWFDWYELPHLINEVVGNIYEHSELLK